MSDAPNNGRQFQVLSILDHVTCERVVLVVDTSFPGTLVARELNRLIGARKASLAEQPYSGALALVRRKIWT